VKYYKVLDTSACSCWVDDFQWHVPKNGKPGKWMPKVKQIISCIRGYHLCKRKDLIEWLGDNIWLAEGRGESIRGKDTTVFQQARLLKKIERWNKKTMRLLAADCAEHVLHIFENKRPNDDRTRKVIQAARDFAEGKISEDDLAAAEDAAWDAAKDTGVAGIAEGYAAWAAARATGGRTKEAAVWEAGVAARDTADYAARAAAKPAGGHARSNKEQQWQTRRLFEYLDGKKGAM